MQNDFIALADHLPQRYPYFSIMKSGDNKEHETETTNAKSEGKKKDWKEKSNSRGNSITVEGTHWGALSPESFLSGFLEEHTD